MNFRPAFVITLFVALAIVVGTVAQGYALVRPAPPRQGLFAVVICGEDGSQTILLDRDGNPVDPGQCPCTVCLDCATAPTLALLSPDVATHAPMTVRRADPFPVLARDLSARHLYAARPRGPPTQI